MVRFDKVQHVRDRSLPRQRRNIQTYLRLLNHVVYSLWLQMQEVQQSKETTLANNRTLAEQNLDLQPRLEHKKEELTKRYNCLQENFEAYQLRKSTLGRDKIL